MKVVGEAVIARLKANWRCCQLEQNALDLEDVRF